jgi:hypothetical protein
MFTLTSWRRRVSFDGPASTLRRFIEAMGGELEITARFPDHDVRIKNFGDIGKSETR